MSLLPLEMISYRKDPGFLVTKLDEVAPLVADPSSDALHHWYWDTPLKLWGQCDENYDNHHWINDSTLFVEVFQNISKFSEEVF